MNQLGFKFFVSFILSFTLVAGCTQSNPTPPAAPTTTPIPTPIPTEPPPTAVPNPFPFSVPGPYAVGTGSISTVDPEREERAVVITLWYPAVKGSSANALEPVKDAKPENSAAPYPLILSSTKVARFFAPIVVSHGFTWASVDNIDTYFTMSKSLFDQPLDILFTLSYVAEKPPAGLEGMIDAEHTGVTGYSFDGYNTYAVSGARIDEKYYRSQCPEPDETTSALVSELSVFGCWPLREWDDFTAHAAPYKVAPEDGLWQPMTDPRIRAVVPMAGEGWWLFGERGLNAVNIPVLILVGTTDGLYKENALMFTKIGSSEKNMISFLGQDHMQISEEDVVARMAHFLVAFFSVHLKGDSDYQKYYSEEFVSQFDILSWGPYTEK